MRRGGDWTCHCGANNFASRDKCFECDDFKSKTFGRGASSNMSSSRSGDWKCSTCGDLVFASRTSCRKCGSTKQGLSTVPSGVGVSSFSIKPGDWQCKSCNSNDWNFGSRTECRNCGAPKESPVVIQTTTQAITPVLAADSETECKICRDRPMSVAFTPCGHVATCDVCCYALDKCPICRKPYTADQIMKVYLA